MYTRFGVYYVGGERDGSVLLSWRKDGGANEDGAFPNDSHVPSSA